VVIGTDTIIRARVPLREGLLGQPYNGANVAARLGAEGEGRSERSRDPLDHTDRLIQFRRVGGYDLVVGTGIDLGAMLAGFESDRDRFVVIGVTLTVLVMGVGALMQRQHHRLVRSQQALTATLQNITQGILMVDADGNIPVMNQQAVKLLGLPSELVQLGPTLREIVQWQVDQGEFGPPERIRPSTLTVLQTGLMQTDPPTLERTRPNGVVLEIRTDALPDGGAVRTFTDITERKRTENALAAARDAALAAGRARGDFLAVMSHEIRTPMNGIIGVAGLLLDMPLGPTEQHYVRIILDSGQHLLQLINDILDFSRLDANRLELEETVFDIRAVVRDAVELLGQEARAKGLELTYDVAENVPQRAGGDAHRLRQVLLNLIGNGIKFTTDGAVRVTVTRLRDEPGAVRIGFAVSDTGIGIPPEAIGRLFTEFTQIDSSISRRFGGSGLGLAISRRLIERMGGTISVESVPGLGSTFRFDAVLAAYRAGGETSSPAAPATGRAVGACRVLVAEDNATNRLVAIRMLERMGHTVVAVENGREAVEAMRDGDYDLVLMDVMMPEMDGLAATEAIRRLPGARGAVPIIGLTANAMRADEAKCLAAGMNFFATKPISGDRLADAIDRVLAGEAPAAGRTAGAPARGFDTARLDALTREIGAEPTEEVLRRFVDGAVEQVDAMSDLAETGRLDLLAHQARLIARSAEMVGLLGIGQVAATVEHRARAGVADELGDLVRQLRFMVPAALDELRTWRAPQ
jgi:signal transduction histidine kinase/CheY-like chemotaxis protein/HPt (histidine-containing phosphotransfer) domain-containing protein